MENQGFGFDDNPFKEQAEDSLNNAGSSPSSPPAVTSPTAAALEDDEDEAPPPPPADRPSSLFERPAPRDAIQIIDAQKTSQGASSSYIVYVIRYNGQDARRRYSDFLSLRATLALLHPCHIVPPLPPKNSLTSYAVKGPNPSKAKADTQLVNRRRRMLAVFLNRCLAHKVFGADRTFLRFLEANVPWSEIMNSPPVTLLPKNPLRAPASDPTDEALLPLFASLPLPSATAVLQAPDQRFLDSEAFTAKFSAHMSGPMEKTNRRLMKRWKEAGTDWQDMGGAMNGVALMEAKEGAEGGLGEAMEKVGQAIDGMAVETTRMVQAWERDFTEPLAEYTQFSGIIKDMLKYRHLKHVQHEMTRELLEGKKTSLEELERSELEAQRLEKALERVLVLGDNDRATSSTGPSGSGLISGLSNSTSSAAAPVVSSSSASISSSSLPSSSSTGTLRRSTSSGTGGGFLGALSHTFHGIVDSDPESTRRNTIGKTRDSISQLDQALVALTTDLRYASQTIQSDLDRFQRQKVVDIREMCLDFATFHKEWAEHNLRNWEEAKAAIDRIDVSVDTNIEY